MKNIRYIGLADVRRMEVSQWAQFGLPGPATQWDASNIWTVTLTDAKAGLMLTHPDEFVEVTGLDFATWASTLTSDFPSGMFADRPAAGHQGAQYYALDAGILFIDTGVAWKDIGNNGKELAHIVVANQFTTTSAVYVDVTGVAWTGVVGSLPLRIFAADGSTYSTIAGSNSLIRVVLDGVEVDHVFLTSSLANEQDSWSIFSRVAPTPGTHTIKLQAAVSSGATIAINNSGLGKTILNIAEVVS